MKKDAIRNAKTFGELLDLKYGKIGEKKREAFEEKAQRFVNSEMLKVVKELSGAWEDSRSSDEIIKGIRDSRVNKQEPEL
jgi:hypothetical protein